MNQRPSVRRALAAANHERATWLGDVAWIVMLAIVIAVVVRLHC